MIAFLSLELKEHVTLQSLLIGNQDDNQASKKIRDQKENKGTNTHRVLKIDR